MRGVSSIQPLFARKSKSLCSAHILSEMFRNQASFISKHFREDDRHFLTSLATSGCSIVVVYAVWDRVVRVRFPAPRQILKYQSFDWYFSILSLGNRRPCEISFRVKRRKVSTWCTETVSFDIPGSIS